MQQASRSSLQTCQFTIHNIGFFLVGTAQKNVGVSIENGDGDGDGDGNRHQQRAGAERGRQMRGEG